MKSLSPIAVPQQLPMTLLSEVLSKNPASPERTKLIQDALEGPNGTALRDQMGEWVIQFLPLEHLVPEKFAAWRPPVRDAMLFVMSNLSAARLAPKLVEQIELPVDTTPEKRLLLLIAKVPGLQKLGQVIARNRHLNRSLRKALAELENGIADVNAVHIREIIAHELGQCLQKYSVRIEPTIFKEASVSAVIRFTWYNPQLEHRERGVFKVMKPYIPECFAEDMDLLARLAKHMGSKHRQYGFAKHVLPDTFQDVRQLLKREVQFVREQKTLLEAQRLYGSVRGVRVPRVIPALCTTKITAMTYEEGRKVTDAISRLSPVRRRRISEQLIEMLVAIPLFAPKGEILFHADPHAGNLLYDERTRQLVILDWALIEKLSYEQRRHFAMFFLMVLLRDPIGTCHEIQVLRKGKGRHGKREAKIIRECVEHFMSHQPIGHFPRPIDAMDLLESIALKGVRLPTALLMLRKVLFTLDGILNDVAGSDFRMELVLARHIVRNWITKWSTIGSPLSVTDWLLVQCSTLLFPSRVWMNWSQSMAQRTEGTSSLKMTQGEIEKSFSKSLGKSRSTGSKTNTALGAALTSA